jgi:hypothetical protein
MLARHVRGVYKSKCPYLQWCCGNLKLRYRTLRQLSRKQCFIVWAQTQRLSPKNKEVFPYIPLQASYRSKKQSSTHLWLHVTSWLFYFPSAMWPSCFNSFKFYLSALPSLSPPTPSRWNTACLFLFWPSSLLQWDQREKGESDRVGWAVPHNPFQGHTPIT